MTEPIKLPPIPDVMTGWYTMHRRDIEQWGRLAVEKATAELRAEVERLRADAADFHMAYRMKCDEETKAQAVEIERLRAAVLLGGIKEGELREDAERYRWLRKGPIMTIQTDGVSKILLNPKFVPVMPGLSEKLDAAIDAALKEPK